VKGERQIIAGTYIISDKNEIGFQVAEYDTRKPLIIDPVLSYSTFLGGNAYDQANSIAVDSLGNAYVTGLTDSTDFPLANSIQNSCNNCNSDTHDIFVTK